MEEDFAFENGERVPLIDFDWRTIERDLDRAKQQIGLVASAAILKGVEDLKDHTARETEKEVFRSLASLPGGPRELFLTVHLISFHQGTHPEARTQKALAKLLGISQGRVSQLITELNRKANKDGPK